MEMFERCSRVKNTDNCRKLLSDLLKSGTNIVRGNKFILNILIQKVLKNFVNI